MDSHARPRWERWRFQNCCLDKIGHSHREAIQRGKTEQFQDEGQCGTQTEGQDTCTLMLVYLRTTQPPLCSSEAQGGQIPNAVTFLENNFLTFLAIFLTSMRWTWDLFFINIKHHISHFHYRLFSCDMCTVNPFLLPHFLKTLFLALMAPFLGSQFLLLPTYPHLHIGKFKMCGICVFESVPSQFNFPFYPFPAGIMCVYHISLSTASWLPSWPLSFLLLLV